MLLKVKLFSDWSAFAENYADCEDDLPSLMNKYNVGLNEFIDNNWKYFEFDSPIFKTQRNSYVLLLHE